VLLVGSSSVLVEAMPDVQFSVLEVTLAVL
jgi:hypothetical protein